MEVNVTWTQHFSFKYNTVLTILTSCFYGPGTISFYVAMSMDLVELSFNEELTTQQLPGVRETTNGYTTQNHKDLGSFKVTCLDGVKINISSENDPHMDLFVGVCQTFRNPKWLCWTKSPFQPCFPIHAMFNFLKIYWTEQNFTGHVLWISGKPECC